MIKLVATVGSETSVAYIDSNNVEAVSEAFTQKFEKDWPEKLAGAVFSFTLVGEPKVAGNGNGKAPKTHKVRASVTGLNFGAKYKYVLPFMHPGDTVVLVHDKDNEAHENAIAVLLLDGSHLGYLTWEDADRFHGRIKDGQYAKIVSIDCRRPGGMVIEFEVPYNL